MQENNLEEYGEVKKPWYKNVLWLILFFAVTGKGILLFFRRSNLDLFKDELNIIKFLEIGFLVVFTIFYLKNLFHNRKKVYFNYKKRVKEKRQIPELIILFLLIQIFLSFLALKETSNIDKYGLTLLFNIWSLFIFPLALSSSLSWDKDNLLKFVNQFVYFSLSIFNITTILLVMRDGVIGGEGLVFLVFPFFHVPIAIGISAVTGIIVYFIKNKFFKK